jgi:hypothetical protein
MKIVEKTARSIGTDNYIEYRMLFQSTHKRMNCEQMLALISKLNKQKMEMIFETNQIEDLICDIEDAIKYREENPRYK